MPVFAYEAIDGRGNKLRKAIEEANKQEALQKIRTMGLKPTKLQEKKGAAAPAAHGALASALDRPSRRHTDRRRDEGARVGLLASHERRARARRFFSPTHEREERDE